METLTQADIEYLVDVIVVSLQILSWCLGFVAGSIR